MTHVSAPLPSDLEIAQAARLRPVTEIAAAAGIAADRLEPYGRFVAKVDPGPDEVSTPEEATERKHARGVRYVVVTALTPTPLGEGKTATAVGLAQGMAATGRSAALTLRQPSMGPTFGIKGGAAGAGYAQLLPMDKLNLHLTGDFHAVTAAHNLLAAMIDNHLHHGNALGLDVRSITWRRVLDVNDRALRTVVVGLGDHQDGVPRQTGFDITAASEVMVILSLATSFADLRRRLGRIVVGYTHDGGPVSAEDLRAAGSMAVLLQDAFQPNLLQSLEGTPALVHAGPFGNIATGNSSVVADYVAMAHADYVITEAGFGADMGLERLVNVKARVSGLTPDAAVLVTTVRALKAHSGRWTVRPGRALPAEMLQEDPGAVEAGAANLLHHLAIARSFGVSPVVAVNAFPGDHPSEHEAIGRIARAAGAQVAVCTAVSDGGAGAAALADAVAAACEHPAGYAPTYGLTESLEDKLTAVATRVYGADGLEITPAAERQLAAYEELGFGGLPVVVAKTHLSTTADPSRHGAPTGWRLPVREVRAAVGAGYLYAICGTMRTMPGLGTSPAAERIGIDDDGRVTGLF